MSEIRNGLPQFMSEVLEAYKPGVAHAFVLHFNTNDYVSPKYPMPASAYLMRFMATSSREIVVAYSRDRGWEFADDGEVSGGMRELAYNLLKAQEQNSDGEMDDMLAALSEMRDSDSNEDFEFPSDPTEALPLLDKLLRANRQVAVIIENAELLVPPADLATMQPDDRVALGMIRRWGSDPELVKSGNPIFLLTSNIANLHPDIKAASHRYETIEIPLPDVDIRLEFVERWLDARDLEIEWETGLDARGLANATAGLSLLHIEDILLRAKTQGEISQRLIWERKEAIIRSEFGEVLEIIQTKNSFADIGGLAHVKDFFKRSVIRPIHKGRYSRVPMGVLMTGPAGTGKSIMAEAVASEANINAVKLRIGGQIASKWQGEGERNLEKALRAIASLAPTLVFIDEIDQAVQRGGNGSGNQQDQRIFQRLLEFMSDTSHRGKVVFLAATNRPDLMDAALRRPGRFDKKIGFFIPDDGERAELFKIFAKKYLDFSANDDIGIDSSFVQNTKGQTGAEIEAICVKAAELVEDYEDEGMSEISALELASEKLTPSTADIEFMTMLAIDETNDIDLLPGRYHSLLRNRDEVKGKIKAARKERQEFQGRGMSDREL